MYRPALSSFTSSKKDQERSTYASITNREVKRILANFFSRFHGQRTKSRSVVIELPWVAEVFLAGAGEFSVLAEGRHIFGRRPKPREKTDLTETGNRARKVSGTQGIIE